MSCYRKLYSQYDYRALMSSQVDHKREFRVVREDRKSCGFPCEAVYVPLGEGSLTLTSSHATARGRERSTANPRSDAGSLGGPIGVKRPAASVGVSEAHCYHYAVLRIFTWVNTKEISESQ
jgi:hypothetical protein